MLARLFASRSDLSEFILPRAARIVVLKHKPNHPQFQSPLTFSLTMTCKALQCLPSFHCSHISYHLASLSSYALCHTSSSLFTEQLFCTCFSSFLSSSPLNVSHVHNRIDVKSFKFFNLRHKYNLRETFLILK